MVLLLGWFWVVWLVFFFPIQLSYAALLLEL